jgi:hypothetical protein
VLPRMRCRLLSLQDNASEQRACLSCRSRSAGEAADVHSPCALIGRRSSSWTTTTVMDYADSICGFEGDGHGRATVGIA